MSLVSLFTILKGGPRSGNFGHSGRPGKHGGSSPGRVWSGGVVEYDGPRLSKLEVGEIGEKLAARILSEKFGTEFTTLNVGVNNSPIDLAGDHLAIECKTGLSSNRADAQQFRATIGEPGKAEKALIAQMTPEEKLAHNAYKRQRILERKHALLEELSKESGEEIKGSTVAIILSPDGKKGDAYLIPGFHLRIGWSKLRDEEFLGTYDT